MKHFSDRLRREGIPIALGMMGGMCGGGGYTISSEVLHKLFTRCCTVPKLCFVYISDPVNPFIGVPLDREKILLILRQSPSSGEILN